jgi:HSP20 family protein
MSVNSPMRQSGALPSVFDDFFKPWNEWFDNSGAMRKVATMPAVNITENKNMYNVSMAVPGMKKEDFVIDVDGNMLSISAQKEEEKENKEDKYTRKEYSYSSFSRSFTIPEDVNRDTIEASYTDGVLKLVLPKKEETKKGELNKKISVK